jgi:hypothetical protein
MSISDQKPTDSGHEPARDPEGAPLPTRFGRDRRRRRSRPEPAPRPERAISEPRVAPDDERPFEDDGGL